MAWVRTWQCVCGHRHEIHVHGPSERPLEQLQRAARCTSCGKKGDCTVTEGPAPSSFATAHLPDPEIPARKARVASLQQALFDIFAGDVRSAGIWLARVDARLRASPERLASESDAGLRRALAAAERLRGRLPDYSAEEWVGKKRSTRRHR